MVASHPCFLGEKTEAQRGEGVTWGHTVSGWQGPDGLLSLHTRSGSPWCPVTLPSMEVCFLRVRGESWVAELGRLYDLWASVPNENTGPLVQKAGKSCSCGFSPGLPWCFLFAL